MDNDKVTEKELSKEFTSFTENIEKLLKLNNEIVFNKIDALEEKVDTYNSHMTALFSKDIEEIKKRQEKDEGRHLEHYADDAKTKEMLQDQGKELREALKELNKEFDKKIDELKKCIDKHRDKTDEELHKINDRLIKEEVTNLTKEKVDEVADRKKEISGGTIFGIIASIVSVVSLLFAFLK